jgi:acyl-CoA thioesterase II
MPEDAGPLKDTMAGTREGERHGPPERNGHGPSSTPGEESPELSEEPDREFFSRALALSSVGGNRFAAPTPPKGRMRLFGGLVAGQCLKAAGMTVDESRVPHSLHTYFTRPGRGGDPLTIEVEELRDGRTFATRQVRAVQNGVPIMEMLASFQSPEPDLDRQFTPVPRVAGPESLRSVQLPLSSAAFDVRPIDPEFRRGPSGPPIHLFPFWIRLLETTDLSALERSCVLTHLSDIGLMGVAIIPGTQLDQRGSGSLDHSLWFHRPHDPSEWLLYTAEPISNTNSRGFGRGVFFSGDGAQIASVAQEARLRHS